MVTSERASLPADAHTALCRLLKLLRPAPAELDAAIRGGSDPEPAETPDGAVPEVAAWLYASWYSHDPSQVSAPPVPGRADVAAALRAAVPASDQWNSGWVAVQCSPTGACIAGRGSVQRQLLPGQYANVARPGLAPQPGDGLAVAALVDWVDPRTGFWHMQSRAGEPSRPLVRVYWNVDWPHVGFVLGALTGALDAGGVRYVLKCPFRAMEFRRVDSIVLYIDREQWESAVPEIERLATELSGRLRPAVPPLTKTISLGVAWADDPGGTESFGESRCRALAPGVLALLRGSAGWDDEEGVATLVDALWSAGIDSTRPWLSGSP